MMLNTITITCRLTHEVKYTHDKNGQPLARFDVANNRGKITNYFTVVAFGARADYAHKYLHAKQKVGITGTMNHYSKQDKDGNYKDYYSIVASSFDPFHERAKQKQSKSIRDLYSKLDKVSKKVGA